MLQFVGNLAVLISFFEAVIFTVGFWFDMRRDDVMSRHVFSFVGAIALILALSILKNFFDPPWFVWVRFAVFLTLPIVLGRHLYLWRHYRKTPDER